jgi:hypothetical protein
MVLGLLLLIRTPEIAFPDTGTTSQQTRPHPAPHLRHCGRHRLPAHPAHRQTIFHSSRPRAARTAPLLRFRTPQRLPTRLSTSSRARHRAVKRGGTFPQLDSAHANDYTPVAARIDDRRVTTICPIQAPVKQTQRCQLEEAMKATRRRSGGGVSRPVGTPYRSASRSLPRPGRPARAGQSTGPCRHRPCGPAGTSG